MKWAILSIVSVLVFGFIAYFIYQYITLPYRQDKLLGGIALSKNDEYIAFGYQKNRKPAVYVAKSDGTDAKKVIDLKITGENNWKPFINFNHNNTQLLVTDFDSTDKNPISILEIIDLNSKNIKIVPTPGILVLQAIFAPNNKTIYFLGSSYYGNYSLIAKRRPHDIDIYSINVDGSGLKKIIDNKAYDMNSLNLLSNGGLITAHVPFGGGVILVPTDNQNNIKSVVLPIVEGTTDDLLTIDIVDELIFTPNSKSVIFTSSRDGTYIYELYKLDTSTKQITKLTDLKSGVAEPVFFNTQDKILFLQQTNWPNYPPLYQLMKVNADGTDLQKINLSV